MTSETQTFIEAKDIKSIRIECCSCHVKTIISLDTEKSREQARSLCTRFQCPNCRSEWFTIKDSTYLDLMARFLDALGAMQDRESHQMAMMFEISSTMPSVSQT